MFLARIAGVRTLFDNPAPLPTNPATADMEHLDRGFQLVVGERHDISVGAVAEDHGLLLHGPLHGGQVNRPHLRVR